MNFYPNVNKRNTGVMSDSMTQKEWINALAEMNLSNIENVPALYESKYGKKMKNKSYIALQNALK
jgi:hypothetical protein